MTTKDISHRTIENPPARQRQIAMAAAFLDISGELFIQSAITAALLSLAQADPTFALMLARAAGASFETLEFAEREDLTARLMAVASKAKRLPR
jgi:hypothetical protein